MLFFVNYLFNFSQKCKKKMCPNLNKKWREVLARKIAKPNPKDSLDDGFGSNSSSIDVNNFSRGSTDSSARAPAVIDGRGNKQQQQNNIERLANRKKYSCSNCKREFIYFKRALQCCKSVNRKFSFTCDKCKTVITSKQNVGRHKVRCANIMARRSKKNSEDDGKRKYDCELCGKCFYYKQALKKHKISFHKVEKEKGTFQCDLCTYSSDSKAVVKKHKTQVHPSSIKQYFCDSCDSSFYSRQGLFSHKLCVHFYKQNELESARCPSSPANEAPSNQAEVMEKDVDSPSESESDENETVDEEYSEDKTRGNSGVLEENSLILTQSKIKRCNGRK